MKFIYPIIKSYFDEMERMFSTDTMEEFLSQKHKDMFLYHMGFGSWIRENILQNNIKLQIAFEEEGINHIDDMSNFIIQVFYFYMHNKKASKC